MRKLVLLTREITRELTMLELLAQCLLFKCLMTSHIYRGGLPSSRDSREIYQLSRIYMCWKCIEKSRIFTSSNVLKLPRTFRNWAKLALLALFWALGGQIGLATWAVRNIMLQTLQVTTLLQRWRRNHYKYRSAL